ncbi:hypothetical protein AAG906_014563 [Vitis piasezkii]
MQLYCFEDRGNRRVALRPELTPSLARLHYQWNMDIIGVPEVMVCLPNLSLWKDLSSIAPNNHYTIKLLTNPV